MNPWDLSCRSSKLPAATAASLASALDQQQAQKFITNHRQQLQFSASLDYNILLQTRTQLQLPQSSPQQPETATNAANTNINANNNLFQNHFSQHFHQRNYLQNHPLLLSSCSTASISAPGSFSSSANSSPASSPASSRSNSLTTSDDAKALQMKLAATSQQNDPTSKPTNTSEASGPTATLRNQSPPQEDKKARKKDQNRRAAYNYRRKKMEEKNKMREEEMRLVYSRVCLIGYAEELEGSIMYILNTKTRKILDKEGNTICFLCPICLQSCDNLLNLRSHLNIIHLESNTPPSASSTKTINKSTIAATSTTCATSSVASVSQVS